MALAWLLERQEKKEIDCANHVLAALTNMEAQVPSLWHIEIANVLLKSERRGIVTEAQVIDYLNKLSHLPITTDDIAVNSRREIIIALARQHHLTAYDATYLEMALRTNAPLATFDNELAEAMRKAGGSVFGDK